MRALKIMAVAVVFSGGTLRAQDAPK